MEENNQYLELRIIKDYFERIELGGEKFDTEKYYDIKVPSGHEYTGARVWTVSNYSRGMGGMSEDTSTITGYFEAGDLEAKLQTGYLLRVNEEVTTAKHREKQIETYQTDLANLYVKRNKLNEEIFGIEQSLGELKKVE